jgi:hypothetical protein
VRIEDFFGNNSYRAERLQIRLSDPPQAESFEFAVKRDVELFRLRRIVEQRGILFFRDLTKIS